jgi:hypothetical protein
MVEQDMSAAEEQHLFGQNVAVEQLDEGLFREFLDAEHEA